jgi:osmotically-inducible protein OsmY
MTATVLRRGSALLAAMLVAAGPALTGCAPIVVAAGVGAGVLIATDRRSTGAQVDDEAIEQKISSAVSKRWGGEVHLNATSYNGAVLLTGEAPAAQIKDEITDIAGKTDRVRTVQNEMVIGTASDMGARTNDSYITSKVKARLVEANRFAPNRVKVVTERSVVYLMGLVSHDEADAAAQMAATTSGVAKVVKVFEYTD